MLLPEDKRFIIIQEHIMNKVRLNITLPKNVANMLNKVKNKSAFIAEAIKERVERKRRTQVMEALREGYKASREEDKIISDEWDSTIGDGIE